MTYYTDLSGFEYDCETLVFGKVTEHVTLSQFDDAIILSSHKC